MAVARLQEQLRRAALVCAFAALILLDPRSGFSADTDCCADLEARIAELEAMAVYKGNNKVNVEVAGAVSRAIMSWEDGQNTDYYIDNNEGADLKIVFYD